MFNGLNRKANKVRGSKAPFIKLPRHIKRSKAYHGLSVYARAALIELIDRYMGANNGMISLAVRELAEELNCGLATALAALRELDDAKLAHPTKIGAWRGKRASDGGSRSCSATKPASCPSPIGSRKTRVSVSREKHRDAFRVRVEKHKVRWRNIKTILSSRRETHRAKNPMITFRG